MICLGRTQVLAIASAILFRTASSQAVVDARLRNAAELSSASVANNESESTVKNLAGHHDSVSPVFITEPANSIDFSVSMWPFRAHNNTKNKKNRTQSPSCSSYSSCDTCNDASWCHWCEGDQACHAMGSIHGCVIGSNCQNKPDDDDDDDRKNNTNGCYSRTSCSECALSSKLCHWCAHDNACHAIGSFKGCVNGVDCFSNDRCKRKVPEPLERYVFTKIGFLPMMFITMVGLGLCLCNTLCFGCFSETKGAYDDLADLVTHAPQHSLVGEQEEHLLPPEPTLEPSLQSPQLSSPVPIVADEGSPADEYTLLVEGSDHGENGEIDRNLLLTSSTTYTAPRQRVPRHMQRMYNACFGCYLVNLFLITVFVFSFMRYYPKIPQYNICNDSVAWQSLIDSITTMKVTADFEILSSISNPNHLDVALDMGQGTFTHNGVFVGSFNIPPVTVKAMSITDMLIIAHLSPDKWDALSLTAEYYQGKLVLHVDAKTTIRIPVLADYSFTTEMHDMVVHVNELSDRHLCACPDWSEAKNRTAHAHSKSMFSLPSWSWNKG